MTDHDDSIPTIGAVGDPLEKTNSDRPLLRVSVVSFGLAVMALIALILATRISEPTTSNTLPELPPVQRVRGRRDGAAIS